jgi:hypothetical protein
MNGRPLAWTGGSLAVLLALGLALSAQAQQAQQPATPVLAVTAPSSVAAVPFGPGERIQYGVWFGIMGRRGQAVSQVTGVETVRGNQAYRLNFTLRGGIPLARVNDRQDSWLDVANLYSHRFRQDLHQVRYKRLRTLDFLPARGIWQQLEDTSNTGPLASNRPLDDVSFLYWSRTLPLEVGRTYEFNRYFKEDGNPVIIQVLRRETVTVPAGTFNTIVVRPLIRTSGLFSDGGEAEVYYTDDARRLIVQVKTKVSFGTLDMRLEEYTPGQRLAATNP